jgi:SAM-dependent methyltransferase
MVHESAAEGYRQESTTYASARPSYHPALIDRSVDAYGSGTIIDLGAGTGIFTRQLVERGLQPIAIEPVAEMRAELQASLPTATALDGTAEHTGLADSSVDTVFVAQAFHWFDHTQALVEVRRILRPGGHLVCVWNVRDETEPWVRGFTDIVDRYAGDTPRHRTMEWRRAIDADPAFALVEDFAVANPVPSSPDAVAARARSTSFIAALDPAQLRDVLEQINELTRPLGPSFEFPYRSELQAWRRQPMSRTSR